MHRAETGAYDRSAKRIFCPPSLFLFFFFRNIPPATACFGRVGSPIFPITVRSINFSFEFFRGARSDQAG